jgi:hypothetical protein
VRYWMRVSTLGIRPSLNFAACIMFGKVNKINVVIRSHFILHCLQHPSHHHLTAFDTILLIISTDSLRSSHLPPVLLFAAANFGYIFQCVS